MPPFAHTTVGVGSMVINNNNEILAVQEKYIKEPHWKLPGGFVDPGIKQIEVQQKKYNF